MVTVGVFGVDDAVEVEDEIFSEGIAELLVSGEEVVYIFLRLDNMLGK